MIGVIVVLGLDTAEARRLMRISAVICLVLIVLTILSDAVGRSGIVTIPAGIVMAIGLIVSGIMYILRLRSIKYAPVLILVTMAAGIGAAIGTLIINLY